MATERVIIQVSETGTRRVQKNVRGIGKAAQGSAGQVNLLKRALQLAGGALILRASIRTLADFGQQMSTVRAITGATATQFAALRDRAKELGAETRFSATQAAAGLENLARAGFNVTEAIDTVGGTLRLAQAGSLDLGTAAQITAGVIRGFRVEVDQAERFIDVLALTANSAATDVIELGEGMKFVAPAAASLRVPFETASAALAVLADNQLRGTLGGTGLRKVLSTLAKGGKPLETALNRVNLTLNDVDIQSVGLVASLEALRKANIGVGEAFEIFGDRGQPAFDVLVSNIPKVVEFNKKFDNAGGTVRRVASIMDDNLNGALLAVRSALEAVILAVGDLGANTSLTKILRLIADGLRFVASNAKVLIAILSGLALVVLPTLVAQLARLSAFFITGGPLGLALFTVGALGAAFFSLGGNVAKARGVIGEELGKTASEVRILAGEIFGQLKTIAAEALKGMGTSFEGFADTAALVFDTIKGLAVGTFSAMIAIFDKAFGTIQGGAVLFGKVIKDVITGKISPAVGAAFLGAAAVTRSQGIDLGELAGSAFLKGFEDSTTGLDILAKIRAARVPVGPPAPPGVAPGAPPSPGGAPGRDVETGQISKQATVLASLVETLKQERELANLSDREREIRIPLLGIINDLKEAGIDIENKFVQAQVKAAEAQLRGIDADRRRQAILDEIKGPEMERLERMRFLKELLDANTISQDEFNEAIKRGNTGLQQATTFAGGLANAFLAVDTSVAKLGERIGQLLLQSIDRASDALSDFAVSGFRDTEALREAFANLLRDLAKGIIKVIIQTLILGAIRRAILGPGAAFGLPTALPRAQAGGPVGAGTPTVVGERGPELFVPPTRGNIIPASQAAGNTPVNLTVVNTSDPEEIPNFFATRDGDEVFLNVMGKNSDKVRALLGVS